MNQLDVFNHRPRKIKCIANDDRGGLCVNGNNAPMLEVGREYNLIDVEMHSWYTLVRLIELPTLQFNSVYFSELVKKDKTISEQFEDIKNQMCRDYCKWTDKRVSPGREDWLLNEENSPCNSCPLTRL